MNFSLKKKLAAGAAVVAIAGGATAAFGYWSTTGSGEGSASTTAGVTDTLDFTTSPISAMYPGDDPQFVTVTLENTDLNETVNVASVKVYLSVVGSGLACDSSDFLLNGDPAPGTDLSAVDLGWTEQELSAGESQSTAGTDTIQFNNKATAQDDCKSADVTLHYLAS